MKIFSPVFCVTGIVLMGLVACSSTSQQVQRGDELMKAEMPEQALEEYKQAALADPDDLEIQARVKQVQKLLIVRSVDECRSLLELGEYETALISFSRILQHGSKNPKTLKTIEGLADRFLQGCKKKLENSNTRMAFLLVDQILDYLDTFEIAEEISKKFKHGWADELYRLAVKRQDEKLYGNSLLLLSLIEKMVGAFRDSADLVDTARNKIKLAGRSFVQLRVGKSKRTKFSLSRELINRIKQATGKLCPALAFEKAAKYDFRIKLGIHGIDFRTNREVSKMEQKYRSGTKKVDNPEVFELKAKIEEGKNQIREIETRLNLDLENIQVYRQAFADAGPEDDEEGIRARLLQAEKQQQKHKNELSKSSQEMRTLRRKLSATPKKLHEPVFSVRPYKVTKVARTAQARARLSVLNDKGVKLFSKNIEGSSSTSDTTCPGQPRYGIKPDPLRFAKTDLMLKREALDQIETGTFGKINGLCSLLKERLLEKMKQTGFQAGKEMIELIILYMYVTGDLPDKEMQTFLEREFVLQLDYALLSGKGRNQDAQSPVQEKEP